MRKPTNCICENKDADQLRGNREADQRLCFHYSDSTIPLLLKSETCADPEGGTGGPDPPWNLKFLPKKRLFRDFWGGGWTPPRL